MGYAVLGIFVLSILMIIFGPLISIWTLNTLFGLGIEYSPATWFASLWLGAIVSSVGNRTGK